VAERETRSGAPRFQITTQQNTETATMTITIASLQPIIAIAAGIAILVMPKLLHYIVAGYLIIFGLLGLGILNF